MKTTNHKPVTVTDVQGLATMAELNALRQLCEDANGQSLEKISRLAYVCRSLDKKLFAYQHTVGFGGLVIFRRQTAGSERKPKLCKIL
jgi:hypothetical protein